MLSAITTNSKTKKQNGKIKFGEVVNIFVMMIVIMVVWLYASVPSHQIIYI